MGHLLILDFIVDFLLAASLTDVYNNGITVPKEKPFAPAIKIFKDQLINCIPAVKEETIECMLMKCINNNCKPPQNFEFPETELSCRFIWFEKFPWVC